MPLDKSNYLNEDKYMHLLIEQIQAEGIVLEDEEAMGLLRENLRKSFNAHSQKTDICEDPASPKVDTVPCKK